MGRANGNASTWKISAFCIFEFFPQFLLRSTEIELLLGKIRTPRCGLPSRRPFGAKPQSFPHGGLRTGVSFSWQPDRRNRQQRQRQTLSINLLGAGQPSGDVTGRLQGHRGRRDVLPGSGWPVAPQSSAGSRQCPARQPAHACAATPASALPAAASTQATGGHGLPRALERLRAGGSADGGPVLRCRAGDDPTPGLSGIVCQPGWMRPALPPRVSQHRCRVSLRPAVPSPGRQRPSTMVCSSTQQPEPFPWQQVFQTLLWR